MIRGETYFKKSKTEQREGVKLYRLIQSICNKMEFTIVKQMIYLLAVAL